MIRKVMIGATIAAAGVAAINWMNHWGATRDEAGAVYPGDELIPDPADQATMAVTVQADPEQVWPWLLQLGQDRGGMYSYDWLERAFGMDLHNATDIKAEWQRLQPGDRIQLVQPGWGPLQDGYAFRVAQVIEPSALVLRQGPPQDPWDGVWTFVIRPDGPGQCRLISRTRTARMPGFGAGLLRVTTLLGTPITWFMTQKMLRTIARLAQARG